MDAWRAKIPTNGIPNFRKFCAKLSFAYWKILVKFLHHRQFLLNWQFSTFQPPTPSVKSAKILEWLLSFYMFSGIALKIYHICRKKTSTQEWTFSSRCCYWMRHLSYQFFLIKKPSIIKKNQSREFLKFSLQYCLLRYWVFYSFLKRSFFYLYQKQKRQKNKQPRQAFLSRK